MATKAYLLIDTAVGKTRDVETKLKGLPGITTVDVVTGPHDIIAVVSGEDMAVVGELVTGHIHNIIGIDKTITCVAVGSQ